ncbi:hypothetical protein G9C98_008167 [Cotesia typhae]|uniref:Uncharacterized protein n=1 Tax=Cotesia typhae TaxID=2053667 RepID=A0A8J5R703_9HYME|nr:hypothetical protein G9C98_008167 [Cotesia typhae]
MEFGDALRLGVQFRDVPSGHFERRPGQRGFPVRPSEASKCPAAQEQTEELQADQQPHGRSL